MKTLARETLAKIEFDARQARDIFRSRRGGEDQEIYDAAINNIRPSVNNLLAELTPAHFEGKSLRALLQDGQVRKVLCYLVAPPISEDDLQTISDVRGLKRKSMTDEEINRIATVLRKRLDRHRIPWLSENRRPTDEELYAAQVATVALLATQAVQTTRRVQSYKGQEMVVENFLKACKFERMTGRPIDLQSEAPPAGYYMGETMLGEGKADFVIGLPGQKILAIECKASNSAVNSHKRLVHEAGHKASSWRKAFGVDFVRVAAVISGVFDPKVVARVASAGEMSVVWEHKIDELGPLLRT